MKWVKVKQSFSVAATGKAYKQGQVVEVSDELAKRHGEKGTGFLLETSKPKAKQATPATEPKQESAAEPEAKQI